LVGGKRSPEPQDGRRARVWPQAFASRMAAERVKDQGWRPEPRLGNSRLPIAARPPQPKASDLLD
jgi:hypothetical protein